MSTRTITDADAEAIARFVVALTPRQDDEWITAERARQKLGGISAITLTRYIRDNKIISNKPPQGGVLMIKTRSINDFLDRNVIKPNKVKFK